MEEESESGVEQEKREIPADIYGLEILAYLPAKNLQALKTVSKDWEALITSPYFVELHHSRASRTRIRILITLSSGILQYNNYNDDTELKKPPHFSSGSNTRIMGSADGLICFFDRRLGGRGVVFNPSTGKCSHLRPESYMFLCTWFGKNADGEFILVMANLCPGGYELGVYNLTTSKLKRIHSIFVDMHLPSGSCFSCLDRGTLVDGAVHWPVVRRVVEQRYSILAYHISENKHWEIPVPAQCDFRLGVMKGCLFTIVKNVVWVMKESVWTKWADIEGFNVDSTKLLSPLGFFPNGDLILDVDKTKLVKYSFIDKVPVILMEYNCSRFEAIMCDDTLVSPSISD